MDFNERKAIASQMVADFLADFSPPRGMDEKQLAGRISNIADAFARRMPVGEKYAEKIDGVFTRIRDTHLSNSWPAQGVFIEQMPRSERIGSAPSSYRSSDENRIATAMSEGRAVPERAIWAHVDVSREVLERYRFASVDNWISVFRGDAKSEMAAKYGTVVLPYFQQAEF